MQCNDYEVMLYVCVDCIVSVKVEPEIKLFFSGCARSFVSGSWRCKWGFLCGRSKAI